MMQNNSLCYSIRDQLYRVPSMFTCDCPGSNHCSLYHRDCVGLILFLVCYVTSYFGVFLILKLIHSYRVAMHTN